MKYVILLFFMIFSFNISAQKRGKPVEKIIIEGAGGIGKIFYDYIYKIEKPGADTTYHVKIQFFEQNHGQTHFIYLNSKSELGEMITETSEALARSGGRDEMSEKSQYVNYIRGGVQIHNQDSKFIDLPKKRAEKLLAWLKRIEANSKLPN